MNTYRALPIIEYDPSARILSHSIDQVLRFGHGPPQVCITMLPAVLCTCRRKFLVQRELPRPERRDDCG